MNLSKTGFFLILFALAPCWPKVTFGGETYPVGSISFEVFEEGGWFGGLGNFRYQDKPLQMEGSLIFPLLADEWGSEPMVGSGLRLTGVEQMEQGLKLTFDLYGGTAPQDWEAFFLWDHNAQTIARDDYRFARTRPLAEINRWDTRAAYFRERGEHLERMGSLVWEIRRFQDSLAGWPWDGWEWRISLALEETLHTTAIRLIGGFEVGGQLEGLTLANQRYRGLGNLEQRLQADEAGRSLMTFNTQDSFARPSPLPEGFQGGNSAFFSRQEALAIRSSSWIHTMARGAGTGFFDFQFSDRMALRAHPLRQGNFRALTEIYPGDAGVGQSSEEHFGATREFSGEWMQYAVLAREEGEPVHFWRTRYLEVDRELRARVSEELGLAQDRVVPSVGYLFDFWQATDNFSRVVVRMSGYAGYLAELGIQRVMTHNPGWENGRAYRHGWDGVNPEKFIGGGVNNVYDWQLLPRVRSPWKELSEVYDVLGIEHYVWLSGMSRSGGGFTSEVGLEPDHWALNSPDGQPNDTYGEIMLKHNILSPRFREVWDQRFDDLAAKYGFSGYWGDSFQNLMMSQLNWAGGKGEPLQRPWWEWLADQSQKGRGWISESHSFPGISCSIETENWDQFPWMMGQVIRWLRGYEQGTRSSRDWGRLLFRVMAYDGWLAPEIWPYHADREVDPETVIEGFRRLSWSFRAATPLMERPYILADGQGVLWTHPDYPHQAVLFPFIRIRLPEGLTGHPILDHSGQRSAIAGGETVTVVYGENPVVAFGLSEPPGKDNRRAFSTRPWTPNLAAGRESLIWRPDAGNHRPDFWRPGEGRWADSSGKESVWPAAGGNRAVFAPQTRTVLEVDGVVRTAGVLTSTPGVELVIPTVQNGEPGALLESSGSLAGPLRIYFQGTLREGRNVYHPGREETGLRFRGGEDLMLQAELLPWPGDFHRNSQIVSLTDPGTTVHFRGFWPAVGELSRPGLILGEGTRFVVWPEAELPFIKNYGGFTLQWWVGRGADGGGILELHDNFIADRSRDGVSPFAPRAEGLRQGSLGSIRLNGVTLLTHHSRSLPLTGRVQDPESGEIQNNGHLVFEYPHGGRWEVRTRPQTYRGAVWMDADTVLYTERDLTLLGKTEAADQTYGYVATNAFQTRQARSREEGAVTIYKEGPAALILGGEQAYVPNTRLEVREGSVVFRGDPMAGGGFPRGEPFAEAGLHVLVKSGARVELAAPVIHLAALEVEEDGIMHWATGGEVRAREKVQLSGVISIGDLPSGERVLLRAPFIGGRPEWMGDEQGELLVRNSGEGDELVLKIP